MKTSNATAIEYRCKTCWQAILAPIENENQSFGCPHCGTQSIVPAASESNLREAEPEVLQESTKPFEPAEIPSDEEMYRMVREQSYVPVQEMDFQGYANASILRRFIAFILDFFVAVVACLIGLFATLAAAKFGVISQYELESESFSWVTLMIFYFPVTVSCLFQWNLIATRGQSIGKFVCFIRIVTIHGRTPGFIQGVLLRNWLRNLLGFIPFFAIIDCALIFGEQRRCIHDYIAGTRVVEA